MRDREYKTFGFSVSTGSPRKKSLDMWADFDAELREKLLVGKDDLTVEVTQAGKVKHLDRLNEIFTHTITTKIPKVKKVKFDGREASAKTKALFDQRIRDFSTGRKIIKSDRKTWNSVIAKSCKQDYHD